MSKKRSRIANLEPFSPFGSDSVSSKRRSKPPKHHQLEQRLVPSAVSSKILNEALLQQKEIQLEEENDEARNNGFVFSQVDDPKNSSKDEEGDLDDFEGFSETQSQSWQRNFEDKIDEEDEKLLEAFLSKDDRPHRTLAKFLQVDSSRVGWQRGVFAVLRNCRGVRFKMDQNGVVEVSGVGDPDRLLKKLGRSRRAKLLWLQFGQCSENLFMAYKKSDPPAQESKPIGSCNNTSFPFQHMHHGYHPTPHFYAPYGSY